MDEQKKIRSPIRVLVAIASIPLWAGIVLTGWSVALGDTYQLHTSHVLAVVLAVCIVSIVCFGKMPHSLLSKRHS